MEDAVDTAVNSTVDVIGNVMTTIYTLGVQFGGKLIGCLLVLIIGSKLISVICKKLATAKFLTRLDVNVANATKKTVKLALWVILIITLASILGIETTSIIALVTSLGVTVGLALQGTMSNVAGGIMILILHPFHVGDFVEAGGATGTVKSISIFHTFIHTNDAKVMMVPNGAITSGTVVNYSTSGMRRVDLDFSASYNANTEMVKKLMVAVASKHEKVVKDPAVFARMSAQGDNACIYTLRAWCQNADYWDVYFDMIEQMKAAFDAAGINIPYPQLDLHVKVPRK